MERPGPRWQQLAEDRLVQLPDGYRGEGRVHERKKGAKGSGFEHFLRVCVCVCGRESLLSSII